MRIAFFTPDPASTPRSGLVDGDRVRAWPAEVSLADLLDPTADRAALRARATAGDHALADVRLVAPPARKGLAVGMNYGDHAREFGADPDAGPGVPTIFTKHVSCLAGPYDDVHLPKVSDQLDYEGELVLVVGRRCRHVPRSRALDCVGAWCVGNDLSVRDWQLRTGQYDIGKSFDTHGPLGPWLTTADEVADPSALRVRTWVNDALRQDGSTGDMLFDPATVLAHLSEAMTLEPGDVIFTGTPPGVGAARTPPAWLRAGDVVRVEVSGADGASLGVLENRVVPEPDAHA